MGRSGRWLTTPLHVLEQIRPYLTKGSIIAFAELAHAKWPGETSALRDTLGTDASHLRLLPGHATPAYLVWEGCRYVRP